MKEVPFTPVDGSSNGATVFTCALCGTRFTHGKQACGTCPLGAGCDVVGCPNCGHSFPRRSRIVSWIRRLAGSREEKKPW